MANPFSDKAKSSSKGKFKNITGRSGDGQKFAGEGQLKGGGGSGVGRMEKAADYKIPGKKAAGGRLDKYARGGRTAKGNNVTITIVNKPKEEEEGQRQPVPVPVPVPAGGPPPGPMAGPPPMGMPPRPMGPPPGPPGLPPPMLRKSGGRVKKR